eukprot:973486-Pyramimonas_sp.AAC.1
MWAPRGGPRGLQEPPKTPRRGDGGEGGGGGQDTTLVMEPYWGPVEPLSVAPRSMVGPLLEPP